MKAACVREFGTPTVIIIHDLRRPRLFPGQLLVRVRAARVGPWDALVREGQVGKPLATSKLGRRIDTAQLGDLLTGVDPLILQACVIGASLAIHKPRPVTRRRNIRVQGQRIEEMS